MTVEERARACQCKIAAEISWVEIDPEEQKTVIGLIAQHFREQIEDCAKILDREAATYAKGAQPEDRDFYPSEWREVHNSAKRIAQEIRALAEPEEEKEKGE